MEDSNNLQEKLLHLYSERSVGSPFVFHPENYGRYAEEPADVAWASNGCVVLMYTKQVKAYEDANKNKRKTQKGIQQNLGQARKWLIHWKEGQKLRGSNAYSEFDIAFGDFPFVIVLSIIETGSAIAEYHKEFAQMYGVALCATVPFSVMETIASNGGSMLDLLSVLVHLKEKGCEISEEELQLQLAEYCSLAQLQSGITPLLSNPVYVNHLQNTGTVISRMRQQASPANSAKIDNDTAAMFNDFSLLQIYMIQRKLVDIMEIMRNDPRKWSCAFIPINDNSGVLVGGTNMLVSENLLAASFQMIEQAKASGFKVIALLYFNIVQLDEQNNYGYSPIVIPVDCTSPSQTEQTLRRFQSTINGKINV
jgi:hypothetical protein